MLNEVWLHNMKMLGGKSNSIGMVFDADFDFFLSQMTYHKND